MNAPVQPLVTGPVIFGLWPLSGMTTIGVTDRDRDETMAAAIESGLTAFDTAYSYGLDGESDRLLGRHIASDRDRFTVIGKVGQRWNGPGVRVVDGSPQTLVRDAETSLKRIGIDRFDLLMLHGIDPSVPVEVSAGAMEALLRRGLAARVGVCNVDVAQLEQFSGATTCSAIQCPLNMLQPDSLETLIPTAMRLGCDVHVYWTLMKGLLAGKITRDHVFAEGDSRPKYDVFQGQARSRAHDVVDEMQRIAGETGRTVAQQSIAWAVGQPGVSAALVGARRPEQVREIANFV